MNRKTPIFLAVFAVGLLLDQATKWWVFTNIDYQTGEIVVIPDLFSIVHAQNPGAAMGFMRDFAYRQWIFLGFTVVAAGVIIDLFRKLPARDWFVSMTLGMIFSGAVGNAIDRVHKQTVTDFLRVYTEHASLKPWLIQKFGTNEWPSFNVADSLLVVGVCLFLVHYLFLEEPEGAKPQAGSGTGGAPPDEGDAATKRSASDTEERVSTGA